MLVRDPPVLDRATVKVGECEDLGGGVQARGGEGARYTEGGIEHIEEGGKERWRDGRGRVDCGRGAGDRHDCGRKRWRGVSVWELSCARGGR